MEKNRSGAGGGFLILIIFGFLFWVVWSSAAPRVNQLLDRQAEYTLMSEGERFHYDHVYELEQKQKSEVWAKERLSK
jgi:hypothetical protein